MKTFKQFQEQIVRKIKSFPVPGTKDKMPIILDTMPTPLEIRKKNFFKKGTIA